MNLSAVILAGGESRRMGQDKSWLEVDGQPLIVRAFSTLRSSGIEQIMISGRAGTDYSRLPCPVVLDLEPGCGPMGGIERALDAASTPLLLVLAVDLAQMTPVFLRKLADHCDRLTGVVPKLRGALEPLAAIYSKRCQDFARDCLVNFRHSARDFAEACIREGAVRIFPVSKVDARCFENWNMPCQVTARNPAPAGGFHPHRL